MKSLIVPVSVLVALRLSSVPLPAEDFQWPQDAISGRFTWPVLFGSPDDMLLKGFDPSHKPPSALARLFAVEDYVKTAFGLEPAQDLVYPAAIDSSVIIWKGDRDAILFARAKPPTKASPSVVGVIFFATKVRRADRDYWTVADAKSIIARGTNADISCQLTSKKSERLDTIDPVITIQRTIGDADDSYATSWSYTLHQNHFVEIQ